MKKTFFVLLGLFLAAMAVTIAVHADIVTIWIGIACVIGAWRSFKAVRRLTPTAPKAPRPWER